jgi:hypothetical protein
MFLARMSRVICLAHILTSQIRPTMIVLKRVCFSEMTLLLLISGCIVFVLKRWMLSDPKHWNHILPFMQPGDVPHKIALTDADICAMHAADGHEDGDVPAAVVTTRSQAASKLRASGELPAPSALPQEAEIQALQGGAAGS